MADSQTKSSFAMSLFLKLLGNDIVGPFVQRTGGAMLRHLPGQITCREFEDFLTIYLEGTLPEAQRKLFERHMKVCPMCRTSLKSYLKVIEMGKLICAEEDKDEVFSEAPRELIEAIIHTTRKG